MSPEDFVASIDVSRETLGRLETYLSLLLRWQRAINLVGPATLHDPWRRHILDSAQLLSHLPATDGAIYDLGSGAGLPGLVLAIMGCNNVHLIESDQRKAQFLREVIRSLGLPVSLQVQRIEALPPECADIITARALAPLPRLLDLAVPLLKPGGQCLFLKGRNASDELTEAGKCWRMASQFFPSRSDPSGSVLKLRDIVRAPLHRQ
ncbi:MAG: 16S rRNA (guanine(527)-N(7))-methyltransferase RsmG [Geminicoccaceae bacterium]